MVFLLQPSLENYETSLLRDRFYAEQKQMCGQILDLVNHTKSCFLRSDFPGHITGSALLCTPQLDRFLLTFHRKLNRWLQLGGHSDGDENTAQVALREAQEESGIQEIVFFNGASLKAEAIFDVDVHRIPGNLKEPEHFHYDVRFLLTTEHPEKVQISEESHELKWFTRTEALALDVDPSLRRLFEKAIELVG